MTDVGKRRFMRDLEAVHAEARGRGGVEIVDDALQAILKRGFAKVH
jgi:hypothetical protein